MFRTQLVGLKYIARPLSNRGSSSSRISAFQSFLSFASFSISASIAFGMKPIITIFVLVAEICVYQPAATAFLRIPRRLLGAPSDPTFRIACDVFVKSLSAHIDSFLVAHDFTHPLFFTGSDSLGSFRDGNPP